MIDCLLIHCDGAHIQVRYRARIGALIGLFSAASGIQGQFRPLPKFGRHMAHWAGGLNGYEPSPGTGDRVWAEAALVVGLVLSLISLASR
jgi:hypothetical protein